jgi:hypothetical protein
MFLSLLLMLPPVAVFGMGDAQAQSQTTHHAGSGHDCCDDDNPVKDESCDTGTPCDDCGVASAIVIHFVKIIPSVPASPPSTGAAAGLPDSYAVPLFRPTIA